LVLGVGDREIGYRFGRPKRAAAPGRAIICFILPMFFIIFRIWPKR
jgi:hypothetical protein